MTDPFMDEYSLNAEYLLYRKNILKEAAKKRLIRNVCEVTGNLCGTDTWKIDDPCQCENCQDYIRQLNKDIDAISSYEANISMNEDPSEGKPIR